MLGPVRRRFLSGIERRPTGAVIEWPCRTAGLGAGQRSADHANAQAPSRPGQGRKHQQPAQVDPRRLAATTTSSLRWMPR